MADSNRTRMWLKFFTDAGIPSTTATDYALTFADNRIQKNMLLDLNKEYLKDMGITLMGDVIAILRHARTVHDQVAREKVLAPKVLRIQEIQDEEEEDIINEVPSAKKTGSAVTRILDHYTRNPATIAGTKTSEIPEKSHRLVSNKVIPKKMRVVAPLKRKTGTLRSDEIEEEEEELDTLRKPLPSILRNSTPTVSSSDSSQSAKKIRRVLPEHEGGYTVTMPKGSTPRSKEILEKFHEIKAQHPKNVFDRLGGESKVSSTTQPDEDIKFRITINNDPYSTIFRNSSPEKTSTSVFERLGNKTVKSSIPKPPPEESHPLPYNGILKPTSSVKKVVKKKKILSTMRADEPKIPIRYRAVPKIKAGIKKPILVKKKIRSTVNTGTEGILGKSYSRSVMEKTPVKDRLGSSSGTTEKKVNKASPVDHDTSSSKNKSFDLEEEEEEESFLSVKEEFRPPLTSKKVSFGKIEQKIIPNLQKELIPDNVGSIVLGTGMFKRK